MIRFEINEFPFALTNDQFSTIAGLIKLDPAQDYDIVEGDQGRGMVWLWVHWEKSDKDLTPTRYWIEVDGNVSLSEDVDWDWQGVGTPTPQPEPAEPEGMVRVEVEWFRGEQFSGEVWVEEGLDGDEFDEAVADAIHNLSQPEENAAFAGCSDFQVTKKKIIPKEESNA